MKNRTNEEAREDVNIRKRNHGAMTAVLLASFPACGLLMIGTFWNLMSSALAFCSCISLLIMSIGFIIAASVRFAWGED